MKWGNTKDQVTKLPEQPTASSSVITGKLMLARDPYEEAWASSYLGTDYILSRMVSGKRNWESLIFCLMNEWIIECFIEPYTVDLMEHVNSIEGYKGAW